MATHRNYANFLCPYATNWREGTEDKQIDYKKVDSCVLLFAHNLFLCEM